MNDLDQYTDEQLRDELKRRAIERRKKYSKRDYLQGV